LVQAFLKKWWVESDFKAPILPLSFTAQRFEGVALSIVLGRPDSILPASYRIKSIATSQTLLKTRNQIVNLALKRSFHPDFLKIDQHLVPKWS